MIAMHHLRHLLVVIFLMVTVTSPAGDHTRKAARTMNYYPDNGDIVCVNGTNRYTRALYGSPTRFRLETSDRPIFATYDRDKSVNISFFIDNGGQLQPLDSTSFCEARYQGGLRHYTLGDDSWQGGQTHISVISTYSCEGAIWRFHTEGFDHRRSFHAIVRKVTKSKMTRDGDYGLEPRSSFEGAGLPLQTLTWTNDSDTYIVLTPEGQLIADTLGAQRYAMEDSIRLSVISRLQIHTPDPYINTLGANLAAAADGLWDGETWLHGCCGWRTPLAGWRAAYVGDVLGWDDRARSHFNAYARSMVTEVPPRYGHPTQDTLRNMARAEEKWGTQMYSNGYICKLPGKADKMSHYDMNLNYVDELLWHFCYHADKDYMRQMWPLLKLHLAWEKRNFDPDGDHLYDAYCCIWASDALYYNGGAVTHSSAYNYRGNLLAARIAELIGEDPTPYRQEADAIINAMNRRLWLKDEGHWAEFQDLMGLKRLHHSAALWTIYTPIDCGACSPSQAWQATLYADRHFPHIPVEQTGGGQLSADDGDYYTLSTTDWLPYDWSTNNVAHEEVMNMALAYFIAGRRNEGFRLLKSDVLDGMFLGSCPGNFGQISYYDKARSEAYRDFGDNIGISSRAIVNGLFGIRPDALNGRCVIQYSLPEEWNDASISTPYLSYTFHRDGQRLTYHVTQHFSEPLQIIIRVGSGDGRFINYQGSSSTTQTINIDISEWQGIEEPSAVTFIGDSHDQTDIDLAGLSDFIIGTRQQNIDLSKFFNANVDDIFRNEYLSPRPPYTTLELPKQGIGQWCLPDRTAHIEDDGLRAKSVKGLFDTGIGISFLTPAEGHNIIYTSLWDNYPESVSIPLKGKASYACLLLAGSTNNMQSRIDNGIITVEYKDGTTDTLHLVNPINWCPIEQDYYLDGLAFSAAALRPYRVHLGSGLVSRNISDHIATGAFSNSVPGNPDSAEPRLIDCGAAEILKMPLNPKKRLKRLTLRTLSCDVVIGLMAITLTK
jgi:hypothetical protein